MTDTPTPQSNSNRMDRIESALDALVDQFVRPALQQSLENQQAIAALITRTDRLTSAIEQHQEWLDTDREDIDQIRADTTSQIQALLDSAREDRKAFRERFDQQEAEIRQNQRLLLAGQARAEAVSERQDAQLDSASEDRKAFTERFSQIQAQLDSASEDRKAFIARFDQQEAEIRQNQRLLLAGQERADAMLAEMLSLSKRVNALEK